jgi:hypothetical protein
VVFPVFRLLTDFFCLYTTTLKWNHKIVEEIMFGYESLVLLSELCFVDDCLSFCLLSFLASVLSVLRLTASDYLFGILDLRLLIIRLES